MKSLAQSNAYLKDKNKRLEMIQEDTFSSSIFEGASPAALKNYQPRKRSASACSKKRASGS